MIICFFKKVLFFLCRDTSWPFNKAMYHTPVIVFKLLPKTQLFMAVNNNKQKGFIFYFLLYQLRFLAKTSP